MLGISKKLPVDLQDTDNITNTWENIKISRLHCTVWNLDKTKGQATGKTCCLYRKVSLCRREVIFHYIFYFCGIKSGKEHIVRFWADGLRRIEAPGAPNENIVQNHLNITLLNVF